MKVLISVGILYLLSGSFCTFNSDSSAQFLGFAMATKYGMVEYITVYGGLQIGLGMAMLLSGLRQSYVEAALFFVLVFSALLAIFRVVSMSVIGMNNEIMMLAVLEWGITIVVGVTWYFEKRKTA